MQPTKKNAVFLALFENNPYLCIVITIALWKKRDIQNLTKNRAWICAANLL